MNKSTEILFVGLLATWLLAGCAGYAACVLSTADAQDVAALAASMPPHWPAAHSSPEYFQCLRLALAGMAGGLALLSIALTRRTPLPCRPSRGAWLPAWRPGLQGWHALRPRQRRWALALLASLTLVRVVVSRLLITFDDVTSYELFVRKSLLVVSTWYPIPNNHVLSNTLSWLFYQVYPGYWWSMRVPVLLLSTLATAGWFVGLLHRSNFRVALLSITLVSFSEISLIYAAEGRGYALLLVLSGVGFFCALALADSAPAPNAAGAWVGLAAAGILGLYTVPTFAYFLVAAYGWLGYRWCRRASRRRLLSLLLVGGTTVAGASLLYAPLLAISGPGALLQNQYVVALPVGRFLRALPAYIGEVEGVFMGESPQGVLAALHVGSLAAAAVVVSFLLLAWASRSGRSAAAAHLQRLGWPALWFAVLPYGLMVAQCVLAPSRTLLFKAVFTFLLVGLEVDWLLRQATPKTSWLRTGLLLAVGAWASMQVVQLYRSNELRLPYLRAEYITHYPPIK